MFGLLVFIFTALIVATIAKALIPGPDPGAGITILLGSAAQILAWFVSQLIGWDQFGQVWSFFLSIAAAAGLLYFYRETDGTVTVGGSEPQPVSAVDEKPVHRAPQPTGSLWARLALAPLWAGTGALLMGVTGFVIGFFGPIWFQPWANQGPMVGIFLTGPGGVLLGGVVGGALRIARPEWPTRRRLWILNAANVAYGLFVLDLVADRSWWR